MIKTITNRLFLLVTMLLLSTVNALAQDVIEIGTVDQLKAFRDKVNKGDYYQIGPNQCLNGDLVGKTIKLTADLDLKGEEWTPIELIVDEPRGGIRTVFDGDGHTISNLTISSQPNLSKGVGLFSRIGGATLKNLTLKNVNIKGNYRVGAFVGVVTGIAQIDKCHLDGATIITSVVNNDNAQHVGGIVGYLASEHNNLTGAYSFVKNCSVKNVTIQGYRDMGSIVGSLNTVTNGTPIEIIGCSAENVTLIQDNTINYKPYTTPSQEKCNIHEIVGRRISDSYTIKDNSSSNVNFVMGKTVSYVAQIGNEKYETLEQAFTFVQGDQTIKLIADVTVSSTEQYVGKNFVLNGDGHTIDMSNAITPSTFPLLFGDGNVSLSNTSFTSGWTSTNTQNYNVIICGEKQNTTAQLSNVSISANSQTALCVQGWEAIKATATLENMTITNTGSRTGKDAYRSAAVASAFGGIIIINSGTYTSEEGQAVRQFSSGGDITINGGVFSGAIVAHLDKGSYSQYPAIITINGGTFNNCSFDVIHNNGDTSANIVIYGGTFDCDPSAYVAAGYKAVKNGNGTWTVKKVTDVAQIGTVKYTTLADAIAAANAKGNVTITLLTDYDFEANEPGYGYTDSFLAQGESTTRNNMLVFSADDITFDLGGHTISNLFNNTFNVTGSNVTFKNGGMSVGQLYYSDLKGNVYTSENQKTCSYIVYVTNATDFTVNDLTTYGGINVSGSTATINDLSFSGTKFYAVCSQDKSTVTLNGGTYTKAITGAAGNMFWVQAGSVMNIVGGTYTKGSLKKFINGINPVITGGTFDFDPTNYGVADGYEAVANNNNTWTVGKVVVGTLTPDPDATETEATYYVPAIVKDGEKEIGTSANAGKDVKVKIATENNAATGATLNDLNIPNVLAKAITTDAAAGQSDINVSIAVVSEETEQAAQTYTYEVYPQATVTVDNKPSSTVKLANSDLADGAKFTFTLDVDGKFDEGSTIQVVHKSADFDDETYYTTVSGKKVSITVTHFSSFELSAAPTLVAANISAVGFATFSSDKALDFTKITAIEAYTAVASGDIVQCTRIYEVPANTGLLLRNPNGAKAVSVGVPVIESAPSVTYNELVAVTDKDIANGDLHDYDDLYYYYILNNVENVGLGFFSPNGYGVDKGRAYLRVSRSKSVSGVQSFTNLVYGETTAIDSITTADEQTQDNVFYDLSGRRVNNPQRGLYIVNGKKVLVK